MSSCAIADLDNQKHVCMGILIKEIDEMIDCYKQFYKFIVNDSYDNMSPLFDKKTSTGNRCIPVLPEKMVIVTNKGKIIIETLCIKKTKYLQKKDSEGDLLYFVGDPNIVNYKDNKTTTKKTKHPVYYYEIKNRITPNYDYAKQASSDVTAFYTEKDIDMCNATTISPNHVYVCTYQDKQIIYDLNVLDDKLELINVIERFISDISLSKKLISEHTEE